ncbi:MAG: hypothetical protein AAGN46_16915 [Acidobacteriota bacterium]
MTSFESAAEPARDTTAGVSLVVLPPELDASLAELTLLDSLAASGRLLVVLATPEQAAILDPTLMHLRLRDRPDDVATPRTLLRDDAWPRAALERLAIAEAILPTPRWVDMWRLTRRGIAHRVGIAGVWQPWLTRTAPPPASGHRAERSHALLQALEVDIVPRERLEITRGWRALGRERLEAARLGGAGGVRIGVWAGSKRDGPRELWTRLLQKIRRRDSGRRLLLLSSTDDLWRAVRLHETTGKVHPVIGPDLSVDGLGAVLSQLDAVVAPSGWPLDLAAAVGARTLGLFERGAAERAPPGAGHGVIEQRPIDQLPIEAILDALDAIVPPGTRAREDRADAESAGS